MDHNKTTLSNGLRIITVPMPSFNSVTAVIFVGAGSRYENKKNTGISHFLEHMTFKGTWKRPTAFDISSTIDGIGGEFNAGTGKEYTLFYVKASEGHLETVLDVLSDMVLNSKLEREEIEREKGVIIEEINMYEDSPRDRVNEFYEEILWPKSPLGWNTAGEKEVIRKIKREDFVEYMENLYVPNNMVVGVAGNFEEEKVKNQIEKYFGHLKGKKTAGFLPADATQARAEAVMHYKKTDQAHFCLGVPAYPLGYKERHSSAVLSTVLGGNMSSRLFINIRERRGLAYYVRSYLGEYLDTGTLFAKAGVKLEKLEEAIKVVCDEFVRIKTEKVGEAELQKAKEYLKGRMDLELEDSRSVAGLYCSEELLEGKIETPEEIRSKIEGVTAEDVLRVAKDIFKTERLNLAVIGPYEDGKKFEKLLKI